MGRFFQRAGTSQTPNNSSQEKNSSSSVVHSPTLISQHLAAMSAYDAMRTVWFPWQHERRMSLEMQRIRTARRNAMIAASYGHSLALRPDGSIACWGDNDGGRAPPEGVDGDFVAIAAGEAHSLAVRRDGGVTCWGRNNVGQAPPNGVAGPFKTQEL